MRKRLIPLLLALPLCLGLSVPVCAAETPFTDVPTDAYYADAVAWALGQGVTGGTTATTFSPDNTCTRAQAVTFLWRAQGSPEPVSATNPFTDVAEGAYYYKAVLWAVEKGITGGTTATTFSPDNTCTNAHVVTFLWRSVGSPVVAGESALAAAHPGKYYTDAVAWAETSGLLNGVGGDFAPSENSPRANIVTYLYRNSNDDSAAEETPATPTDDVTATEKHPGDNIPAPESAEFFGEIDEKTQRFFEAIGMGPHDDVTDAKDVNVAIDAGKSNAYPTVGFTDSANVNGYHTDCDLKSNGAYLVYSGLDVLNRYRREAGATEFEWVTADSAEEYALLTVQHKRTPYPSVPSWTEAKDIEDAVYKLWNNVGGCYHGMYNIAYGGSDGYGSVAISCYEEDGVKYYAFVFAHNGTPYEYSNRTFNNYGID